MVVGIADARSHVQTCKRVIVCGGLNARHASRPHLVLLNSAHADPIYKTTIDRGRAIRAIWRKGSRAAAGLVAEPLSGWKDHLAR